MKKLLLLVIALLLISSGAFASKARMQALGQDAEAGSYYVSDTRSVFTNPAYVNSYKNYIITEWGQTANQPGCRATRLNNVTISWPSGYHTSATRRANTLP